MQELKSALSRAETEKKSLREAMVQTETLIKQARHEHEQEISEASAAAATECEALRRKCNDLQLAVCSMLAHVIGQDVSDVHTRFKISMSNAVRVSTQW